MDSIQELTIVDKGTLDYYEQTSKEQEELLPVFKGLIKHSKTSANVFDAIEVGQELTRLEIAYLFFVNAFLCLCVIPIFTSFVSLKPRQFIAIMACGKCVRLLSKPGLYWVPPSTKRLLVLNNLNAKTLSNIILVDGNGCPLEISVNVCSRITNPLMASFNCVNLKKLLKTNVRELLLKFVAKIPFQSNPGIISIQTHSKAFGDLLMQALQHRMKCVGVEIVSVQITEISYTPEIAAGILQIQQARAKLEARKTIVKGSVGIVADLIKSLSNIDVAWQQDVSDQVAKSLLTSLCSNSGHPQAVLMLD